MRKQVFVCVSLFLHALPVASQAMWMYRGVFAIPNSPILAQAIDNVSVGKQALRTLLDYYKYMERNMTAIAATKDKYDPLDTGNMPMFLNLYGWPAMNETQRVYLPEKRRTKTKTAARAENDRFSVAEARFKASERLVFKALANLGNSLDSPPAAKATKDLLNWTSVWHDLRKNFTTKGGTHDCSIRANLAYRINGRWCIGATVTNDRPTAFRPQRERKSLTEYLFLNAAGHVAVQPQLFNLNIHPELTRKYWRGLPYNRNSTSSPDARTHADAHMTEWSGQAKIVFFKDRPIEENIALVEALESSKDLTRQALDSRLFSNSAILTLPLFMALLPVALFADVSDAALLGYLILTDFLTVIPLGIKGVELLLAGLTEYFSTRTKVWGDLQSNSTVVAGTWSCKCRSAMNLTALGSFFISVAAAALVVGLALEFIAKSQVEKLKAQRAQLRAQEYGKSEYLWERRYPCNECRCGERLQDTSLSTVAGGLIGHLRARRRRDAAKNEEDLENTIGIKSHPLG